MYQNLIWKMRWGNACSYSPGMGKLVPVMSATRVELCPHESDHLTFPRVHVLERHAWQATYCTTYTYYTVHAL